METMILGTIPNLRLTGEEVYNLGYGMFLSSKGDGLPILNNKGLVKLIGTSAQESFNNNALYTINFKDDMDDISLSSLLFSSRSVINNFLFSLWLAKDNSIHLDTLIGINTKETSINKSPLTNFDAAGNYSMNEISHEELLRALQYWTLSLNLTKSNKDKEKDIQVDTIGNFTTHFMTDMKAPTRLSRARIFINQARITSLRPAKIASYIVALEALLSNSNAGVAKQVSERAAKLLEEKLENRIDIFNFIYEAYNIRSSYVHGSEVDLLGKSFNKKLRKLSLENTEEFMQKLDQTVRRMYLLFLTDLKHVDSMSQEEYATWTQELALK